MAYITLAEIKTYLGIVTNTDDDLLDDLIEDAQAFIEDETEKIFEVTADSTRYFTYGEDTGHWRRLDRSRDRRTLFLDFDLAAPPTTITNGDGVDVDLDDVILLPLNQAPYRQIRLKENVSIAWTYSDSREASISVTGKWGWSVTPPKRIRQAMRRLVGFMYRQKDAQTYDFAGVSELGIMRIKHEIPKDIMYLLEPYKERFG